MTRNIEAYEEFLRGMANIYKYTPDSILTAIDHLERAVDIDPDFGRGWLELSAAYGAGQLILPPGQTVEFRARKVAAEEHARTVAPDIPTLLVHTVEQYADNGNWLEADRILQQILDRYGHSNVDANRYVGILLDKMISSVIDAWAYQTTPHEMRNVCKNLDLMLINSCFL